MKYPTWLYLNLTSKITHRCRSCAKGAPTRPIALSRGGPEVASLVSSGELRVCGSSSGCPSWLGNWIRASAIHDFAGHFLPSETMKFTMQLWKSTIQCHSPWCCHTLSFYKRYLHLQTGPVAAQKSSQIWTWKKSLIIISIGIMIG